MVDFYIKGHPRYRLVMRYLSFFDQLQCQGFVIKFDSEYGTWRCPGTAHKMVFHGGRSSCMKSAYGSKEELSGEDAAGTGTS